MSNCKLFSLSIFVSRFQGLHPVAKIFIFLIAAGIPVNLIANNVYSYDSSWTVGEWLISYAGGFVRRGLPGEALHSLSSSLGIQAIYLIWLASLISYGILVLLLWNFCRDRLGAVLILSPMILLGPILGNYFIRKDVLIMALYGLCLLSIANYKKASRGELLYFASVNILSIFAVLSHESYGFWALPSLLLVLSFLLSTSGRIGWSSLAKGVLALAPSIVAFGLCIVFKGSGVNALQIHRSWQGVAHLLASTGSLADPAPTGAVNAIGWTTAEGLRLSYSTLSDFSFLIWVPAAWMLTIYVCINLFIGKSGERDASLKRVIVLFQLLIISPLFVLGWDFGRWIFMWIASSALLYGFASQHLDGYLISMSISSRSEKALQNSFPGIVLNGKKNYFLLLLGIPGCCWTIGRFLSATPVVNLFGYPLVIVKAMVEGLVRS